MDLPAVARLRVDAPFTQERSRLRLAGLLAQESGLVAPGAFEAMGRVTEGGDFHFKRVANGPLARFIVPKVVGRVVATAGGSRIQAAVKPGTQVLLPPALVLAYGALRSSERGLLVFAAVLGIGLTLVALLQEVAWARRFLRRLAGALPE